MPDISMFATNTYDKSSIPKARSLGCALEVEEYLWTCDADEIAAKRKSVAEMSDGFAKKSFHGTAVSRDVEYINGLPDAELLAIYNESYGHADFHGINKIVYHSHFVRSHMPVSEWINSKAAFWRRFLCGKPASVKVYIENFIDDTPDMLARLCDAVGDPRFRVCLDTGHAVCNSTVPLSEWISVLGRRVEHAHIHNNDGISDRHWPLGRGVLDFAAVLERLTTHANVETYVLECDFDSGIQWLRENNYI